MTAVSSPENTQHTMQVPNTKPVILLPTQVAFTNADLGQTAVGVAAQRLTMPQALAALGKMRGLSINTRVAVILL